MRVESRMANESLFVPFILSLLSISSLPYEFRNLFANDLEPQYHGNLSIHTYTEREKKEQKVHSCQRTNWK